MQKSRPDYSDRLSLARLKGLEPLPYWFVASHSIQPVSYTHLAGTLVVTAKEACLWTDGRYFIQAANQLKDTTVTLMKMGEEGTPAIEDYLYNVVPAKGKLGFDGRVMTAALGRALTERLADKKAVLSTGEDLVGMIWEDRPALSAEPDVYKRQYFGRVLRQSGWTRGIRMLWRCGSCQHDPLSGISYHDRQRRRAG